MEKNTKKTSLKRQFEGEVVSTKMNKTVIVLVKTTKEHPKYRKQYVTSKRYASHDEKGEARLGDLVVIEECRPLSKTKNTRIVEVVRRA